MTKEELKKEAEEWLKKNSKEFILNPKYSPFDYAEAIYLAGAELREKHIAELEAQIEKMKCCGNCKYYQFSPSYCYKTCTKEGKLQDADYRSCKFDLEFWEIK